MLDFYTNYNLSSFTVIKATRGSTLINRLLSHDNITRFLSDESLSSSNLWRYVKQFVHEIESSDAVLIIGDAIATKSHMDGNDIGYWYFGHTDEEIVKKINLLSVLYHSRHLRFDSFTCTRSANTVSLSVLPAVCFCETWASSQRYQSLI